MAKEKKESNPKKESKSKSIQSLSDNCGPLPTKPGLGMGEWQCRDGRWVWIEEIGG